ncbi:alpha/beta hydrolase, partial [Mycobacterium stomatepiae]|nr:alpha/beta hydrolase [Mycobacterium stomatepiae]
MPGTGSDDDYVRRAFHYPLQQVGATLVTHRPQPDRLIQGYVDDRRRGGPRSGPILVGGVSIGAAVAAAWSLRHPEQVVGVLAALPAWTGV